MPFPANIVWPLYVPLAWRKEIVGNAFCVIRVNTIFVNRARNFAGCSTSENHAAIIVHAFERMSALQALLLPIRIEHWKIKRLELNDSGRLGFHGIHVNTDAGPR